jgi:hypothetical protein
MRHLKTFENRQLQGNPVIFTTVRFGDDEPVYALYADGELIKYGDYYHDKIQDWIKGFIAGVKWGDVPTVCYEEVSTNEELIDAVCMMGNPVPEKLSDIYNSTNELFGLGKSMRMLKHLEERDADEIRILCEKDQIFDLEFNVKKLKNKTVSTYTFNISSWEPLKEFDVVRVELTNLLKVNILTPGLTEYRVYVNNKELNCSNKISKDIFRILKGK